MKDHVRVVGVANLLYKQVHVHMYIRIGEYKKDSAYSGKEHHFSELKHVNPILSR